MQSRIVFALGMVSGVIITALLSGTRARAEAADAATRTAEMQSPVTYANSYRIRATTDEVIIELGLNSPATGSPTDPQGKDSLYIITSRVVMNYSNTKRLQDSLGKLIKRYEEKYGEIAPTDEPKK